jgi:hypothetical protein
MTATTRPATAPPEASVARRARLGAVGGALYALTPVAWAAGDIRTVEYGTASSLAVAAGHWAAAVLAPVLLVVGLTALRSAIGPAAGRAGTAGIVTAAAGTTAFAAGNAAQLVSLVAVGDTVVAGYVVSYVGMLVALVGFLLVGIPVLRRRRDVASRVAGWLLVLAIPLLVGLGVLFAHAMPHSDAASSIATNVPIGLAWLLLGSSLARDVRRSPAVA